MATARTPLPKTPTGIAGLDEITGGGLPAGRPTLVCGAAGCGKTLFGAEFLVRGAVEFAEPGVFMAFEESTEELTRNLSSLGFDLDSLVASRRLILETVEVDRRQVEVSGEFDLDALFLRLGHAIDSIGARRLVLDTIEILFASLPNPMIVRAELHRLFRWIKERGVTAIVTGERGEVSLTRQGLEEYVSDCVISMENRVKDLISTRRLRIVKYRGSSHGSNEYPFLIDTDGLSVLPITSLGLAHIAPTERVSSGIPRLDAMLSGQGFYRGSSILVSGTAGTGKTSLSAHFTAAACGRGERVLYFAFEESPDQILRNQRAAGIDLGLWVERGLLRFEANRPTFSGLEQHLVAMHRAITAFTPRIVILDPLNGFLSKGNQDEVRTMLMRLVDYLKVQQITGYFTSLTEGGSTPDQTDTAISSLIDTWLLLLAVESGGERNRCLSILKSRGMAHSNQTREFLITDRGVKVLDVYVGPGGVLTGSARLTQEAAEKAERLVRRQEIEHQQRELERQRARVKAQIAVLEGDLAAQEAETLAMIERERTREKVLRQARIDMARVRKADAESPPEDLS